MLQTCLFFFFFMKKVVLLALLTVVCCTACRHDAGRPRDVLSHDQMVDLLTDAYLLEGFYAVETQYRYDVLTEQTLHSYDSILEVHHTSRQAVEHSIDYYMGRLDEYKEIHEEVVARLEAERDSLMN